MVPCLTFASFAWYHAIVNYNSTSFSGAVKHSLVKQEVIPMSYPIYKRPFP